MIASIKPGVLFPESEAEKIPSELIYDIIDGKPYLHKFSQGVFSRALIRSYLFEVLFEGIEKGSNLLIASAPTLFINDRSLVTCDIMVFEKHKLTIDENYAQIPPKITIDLDIKVELGDLTEDEYIFLKMTKLVNFGVEKAIWVFTNSKKVVVMDSQTWISKKWDDDVDILTGIKCNIAQSLRDTPMKEQ